MTETRLSHSRASGYGKCGEQYRLSRIEGVPEVPSLALLGGQAFHDWAEEFEMFRLGIHPGPDPFGSYFQYHLAEAEGESELGRERFKPSGRRTKDHPNKEDLTVWEYELGPQMVEAFEAFDWGEWEIADDLPADGHGNTLGLEYHIEIEGFQGFVDRIDRDRRGNLRVVDYKTGLRVYPSVQIELYMVALQKLGLRGAYGGYYNARKGELTYRPVKWSVDVFDTYLARQRQGIDAGIYPINAGEHCAWCGVAAHCAFSA